jgi:hypothetical protein
MSVAAEEGASSDDVDRRRRKPQLVCAMSGSARQIGLEPRILVARADANFVPILYPSELTHADLSAPGTAQMSQSGPTSPRSAGLITRRSQVQILPPLLRKALETGPFSLSVGSRETLPAGQEQRPRAQKGVVVLGVDDDSSRQRGGCQFARRRRIHGSDCCTARAEAVPRSGLDADRPASTAVTVPPSASAVADGGELLGQPAAEGRHACEEA